MRTMRRSLPNTTTPSPTSRLTTTSSPSSLSTLARKYATRRVPTDGGVCSRRWVVVTGGGGGGQRSLRFGRAQSEGSGVRSTLARHGQRSPGPKVRLLAAGLDRSRMPGCGEACETLSKNRELHTHVMSNEIKFPLKNNSVPVYVMSNEINSH